MASRSSAARSKAGAKARITPKQKSARRKNIAIARSSKKKTSARGTKSRPTSAKSEGMRKYPELRKQHSKTRTKILRDILKAIK